MPADQRDAADQLEASVLVDISREEAWTATRDVLMISIPAERLFLYGSDMHRLNPYGVCRESWLNDNIIDVYFWMMGQRELKRMKAALRAGSTSKRPHHMYFSFFIAALINMDNNGGYHEYNFKNIRRWKCRKPWATDGNLFELGKLFIPINRDYKQHYGLAVIDFEKKKLEYWDAMGHSGKFFLEHLRQYLIDEVEDTFKDSMKARAMQADIANWPSSGGLGPRQDNDKDCGVFACQTTSFLALDLPVTYSQDNILDLRCLMTDELMRLYMDINGTSLPVS